MEHRSPNFPLRALLLDVDGTLVDTIGKIVAGLSDAYARFGAGRLTPETIRALIGLPLRDQMNLFGLSDRAEESVDERVSFAMSRYEAHSELAKPFQCALDLLARARAMGVRTALVTSRSAPERDWILTRFPALRGADECVCASDVTQPKPHPESALLACARIQVPPVSCVYVGDSVHDMECARQAGCVSLGVSYGSASREALAATRPDFLVDSPAELAGWVETHVFNPLCNRTILKTAR